MHKKWDTPDTPDEDEEECYHVWINEGDKQRCAYCDVVHELSDRCKAGDHCQCMGGRCCWCGYLRPMREINEGDLKKALTWWDTMEDKMKEGDY